MIVIQSAEVGPERILKTDALQPCLFRTARGTLFAHWHLSHRPGYDKPTHNVFLGVPDSAISRDNGATWRHWAVPKEQLPGPITSGAIVEPPGSPIMIFEWMAEGPDENGVFNGKLWESTDDLQTVSGPLPFRVRIPNAVTGYDDAGEPYRALTFHETVLALPNGDLLAVVYGWLKGDDVSVAYQPRMRKTRCMCIRSSDRGRNWRFVSTVAEPADAETEEGFNESSLVRLSGGENAGRLLCVMRTGCYDGAIYCAHSDDEGATWSDPEPLPLMGVDPLLIEMNDGTLALTSGRRSRKAAAQENSVAFSADQGRTWGCVARLPLESYAVRSNETTCYIALCQTGPDELLAVYDVGHWDHLIRYVAARSLRLVRKSASMQPLSS
ncbi:MAG: exo-alpha-sialidase [Lentisphaerae bacterium]|nr:exo-alpha-sialidase [Lentisphaerota bacterium]